MPAYLVDTNIIIDHLRQHKSILSFIEKCQDKNYPLRISAITRAEVQAGQSMAKPAVAQEVRKLLSIFDLISFDTPIADKAGQLKRRHKMNLIDAIIAASAILTRSTLLTRNIRHFKNIPNLKIKSSL